VWKVAGKGALRGSAHKATRGHTHGSCNKPEKLGVKICKNLKLFD
jgi:hypothetical protein